MKWRLYPIVLMFWRERKGYFPYIKLFKKAQNAATKPDEKSEFKRDTDALEKEFSVKLDQMQIQLSDLGKDLTVVGDILGTDLEKPLVGIYLTYFSLCISKK